MNKIPVIDFQFWYEVSKNINAKRDIDNTPVINRHHGVIKMIEDKYIQEKIETAYFTRFKSKEEVLLEIKRLKNLTYIELENEIFKKIQKVRKYNFLKNKNKNNEFMEIFDLIQIWGGIPGGGGPYQTRNGVTWRSNNEINWINLYKNAAYKASCGDISAYNDFRKIKHLGGLAFASKHAYFFSKHLNNNSLIIIDEKIAHCFKIFHANDIDTSIAKDILLQTSIAAKNYKLIRWQIEKSLFTFHSLNFKARKIINNTFNNKDARAKSDLLEWYKSSKNKYKKNKSTPNGKTSVFKLTTKDDIFYTYRKNCNSINHLKFIISAPLKKNQKWAQKWFNEKNKIEIIKTFESVEDAKSYVKKLRL